MANKSVFSVFKKRFDSSKEMNVLLTEMLDTVITVFKGTCFDACYCEFDSMDCGKEYPGTIQQYEYDAFLEKLSLLTLELRRFELRRFEFFISPEKTSFFSEVSYGYDDKSKNYFIRIILREKVDA